MDLIAKKYRVLKTLGQGAMGEVFLVMPPHGDPVALKLLKAGDGKADKASRAAIEQFENEFKVLKKMSHPNIGRIYDYGYDPNLKKVYFTSPWLKGTDLFVASKEKSFMEVEELLVQLLRALNYLHQRNVMHCDLKPGNVFVEDGQILLIDFGLAGYWGESIVGTPTYLAPEIFKGEHQNVQSDLYALGVIFYNCLTRTQPFAGKTLQDVYDRHRTYTPPVLHEINSQVPKYMSDIALTLLAKKPDERYKSAVEVIEEISAYSSKKYSIETADTLLSYLPRTSDVIGRGDALWNIENQVGHFLGKKQGARFVGLYLYGESGVGKSKFVGQIKTTLQLAKKQVEVMALPLTASDKEVFALTEAVILEDLEDYLQTLGDGRAQGDKGLQYLEDFKSNLEQKILSPDTGRFLLVATGQRKDDGKIFMSLFPQDECLFESVEIPPFSAAETITFLHTIIGEAEIPQGFIDEIFRNTGGNPALCQQIVEQMIHQGLLFDESGRWSPDLLASLSTTLKKVEPPKSLAEKLAKEYGTFHDQEKLLVHLLALSPHGLTATMLSGLLQCGDPAVFLAAATVKKIVRQEGNFYYLYRSAFVGFILQQLSLQEQKHLHGKLADPGIGLEEIHIWYHQSFAGNPMLMQGALQKLGCELSRRGEKEKALECYERLSLTFVRAPLPDRLTWTVKAAEILIWLDRFKEAEDMLTPLEAVLIEKPGVVPLGDSLHLWEKKGLALLHQRKLEEAGYYFGEGEKMAMGHEEVRADAIRFINNRAQIDVLTGKPDQAIEKFKKSREMTAQLSPQDLERITNNDLGHIYFSQRRYDEAIEILQADIAVFQYLAFKEPLARVVYSLAECYRAKREFDRAIDEYEKCIAICQAENLLPMLLRTYNGLGNIFLVNGDYKDALDTYQRAVEISVHLKDLTTKAALLANQGLIYRQQKNLTQAGRRFLLAKQILESKATAPLAYESQILAKCYHELAAIAKEENNSIKALSFRTEQMRLVEQSPTLRDDQFIVRFELVKLYIENRLGEPYQAEIKKLADLAKTAEQKAHVASLEEEWKSIMAVDQEGTMEVKL